jgi:hypothetical protein
VAQEEQGFGPFHPEHLPPPDLPEVVGTQFTSNLGPGWTGSYHAQEGFQVINKPCVRKTRYVCLISWTLRSGSEQAGWLIYSKKSSQLKWKVSKKVRKPFFVNVENHRFWTASAVRDLKKEE